jgi:hypothetical protein
MPRRSCRVTVACLLLAVTAPVAAQQRNWTYANGKAFRAEFVRELDGDVTLLQDGKLIHVPLAQLSDEDQRRIGQLQEKESDAPATAATEPADRSASPFGGDPKSPASRLPALSPPAAKKSKVEQPTTRTWTNTQGEQTIGKFVRFVGRSVVILRGARTATLDFDSLTPEDQAYVRDLMIARGDTPPPVAGQDNIEAPPIEAPQQPGLNQPARPAAGSEPQASGPLMPRGGSAFFEEMRQREQEHRQELQKQFEEQRRHAAEAAAKPAEQAAHRAHEAAATAIPQPSPPSDVPARTFSPPPASSDESAPAGSKPASRIAVDHQTWAEMRPVIVIALVIVSVVGTIGMMVFVGITVAAANSAPRQRRY